MRKLFLDGLRCETKILNVGTRKLYAFIINNKHLLVEDVRNAMADESLQLSLAIPKTTEKPIGFPLEMIFTYDGSAKSQVEMTKNVYKGYLSSAEKRSMPEKLLERHCESSTNIKGSSIFLLCIPIILESKSHSTQIILLALQMVAHG